MGGAGRVAERRDETKEGAVMAIVAVKRLASLELRNASLHHQSATATPLVVCWVVDSY